MEHPGDTLCAWFAILTMAYTRPRVHKRPRPRWNHCMLGDLHPVVPRLLTLANYLLGAVRA